MIAFLHQAIFNTYPDAVSVSVVDDQIIATDGAGISINIDPAIVSVEQQRLAVEFDNTEYQRTRAHQYPTVADQLDLLWHAIDSGSLDKDSAFYTTLKAVKDANPKA